MTQPGQGWHPPGETPAPYPQSPYPQSQQPQSQHPQYLGPPPTAPHDPGSAPQAYANPYANPNPYGYPYPTPYGYPAVQPGQQRPGTLTAAAVLGYVNAGLLLIAGLLLFAGASLVNSLDEASDSVDANDFTAELTFDGFLNLLAGGLLIAGAVIMSGRRSNGRVLFSVGAAIVIIEAVYWLGRWGSRVDDVSGVVIYALLFGSLAVVGSALAWTRDGSGWLRSAPARPSPPTYFR
jgi:hypothetical protein